MKKIAILSLTLLFLVTFMICVAEAVLYPGIALKYLKVLSPSILLILSVAVSFLMSWWLSVDDWNNYFSHWVARIAERIISVVAPLSFVVAVGLYVFEFSQYPNYSFATFHLHYTTFLLLSVFLCFLWAAFFFISRGANKTELLSLPIWAVLLIFLIPNLGQGLAAMVKSNVYIAAHPSDSYDQKMTYSWGPFFQYMLFVRDNTPADAVIALPPQRAPWINVGNAGLVRYFLYPREVINGEMTALPPRPVTHILLSQIEVSNVVAEDWVWPSWSLPVRQIITYDSGTKEVKTLPVNLFQPDNFRRAESWGILVLKE